MRVVWRFQAGDQTRTFTIRYRFSGLAVGYDDVVDVNLKVWGDEWEQSLGRLTATMSGPGRGPARMGQAGLGTRRRDDRRLIARCCARSMSARVSSSSCGRSIPRSAFTSTAAMRVEDGAGLEEIVAEERRTLRRTSGTASESTPRATTSLRTALIVLALGGRAGSARDHRRLLVASAASGAPATTASTSRSRRPTPSLRSSPRCSARAGRRGRTSSRRRCSTSSAAGDYNAEPTTTERKIWGGLRTEEVADLELSAGEPQELTPLGGRRRRRRRRRARRRVRAALALPRADRGRPGVDVASASGVQGRRRTEVGRSDAGSGRPARSRSSLRGVVFAVVGSAPALPRAATAGAPSIRADADVVLVGPRGLRCVVDAAARRSAR